MTHNIHMMSSDKKCVQFQALHRLSDRTDAFADVLGEYQSVCTYTEQLVLVKSTTYYDIVRKLIFRS